MHVEICKNKLYDVYVCAENDVRLRGELLTF